MVNKTNHEEKLNYEVVVVGAGPAGMMAAIEAARGGVSVLLLEKNRNLGKKLLITGGGRCNVTNNKPVVREMLSQYKTEGKYLFSTFMQHGVSETVDWFAQRGVGMKEENEGRFFPESESAQTIRDTLAHELKVVGVEIKNNASVKNIEKEQDRFVINLRTGGSVQARKCIVATGGTARPETGSTGEGFTWLASLGHTVVENSFALVPVTLKTGWTKKLSGLTLDKCKVTILSDGKKQSVSTGKVLFTHVGLTGPTILNMSKSIGELLSYAPVTLLIDLFPGVDSAAMNTVFTELLKKNQNKKIRNAFAELLPAAVAKELLVQCDIDGETQCNSVTKKQRNELISYVKAIPLEVSGLLGKEKAVASAGGVLLDEVDFKTMESKVVPGLYLVGDVLNINRPSGGYSLQLCWSTGWVAGKSAVANE